MSRRIAALKPLRSPAGGVLFIRCSVVPEEKMPEMLVAPPAVERSGAWFHHGYESTHPPEPLLNALLHSDCTAKVPVDKAMSAAAPCPEEIQAHLSPFSAPRSEEHTSELQSRLHLVCRLLLEKKNKRPKAPHDSPTYG